MQPDPKHTARVKKELIAAGVTAYGLMKVESRRLPETLHQDEHIGGVVYGQYKGGSGMLVATDHRIIFIDRKPLFVTMDELTYDVVSGVRLDKSGFLNSVTLHTRVGEYSIRYANYKCASTFVKCIEQMRLEKNTDAPFHVDKRNMQSSHSDSLRRKDVHPPKQPISGTILSFLRAHELGVLSTVDRTGNIHGTPVYYRIGETGEVYIITKQGTEKARNIRIHGSVGFTIYDAEKGQTLHIQGKAEYEDDQFIKDWMYSEIVKPRIFDGEVRLPPVAYLREGSFVVVRLSIIGAKYVDYERVAKES